MRLLEAAAAGALIISDDFAFPRYWFRDSVLYVDPELPPALVVEQIKGHVEWACENPEAANRRARLSTELFRRSLSLDRILERVPEFVDRVRQSCRMFVASDRPCHGPTVEYILRIGSKPIKDLATALDSLANQTYRNIALTLVQLHHLEGLEEVISSYRPKFRWLRQHIVANDDGERTDLNSIKADFFGVLDHGDALHPNHVAMILDHFERYPECGLVYSGVIRVETDEGRYIDAINFQGPGDTTIAETRELKFFDSPDRARPESLYDCIQSNAWLCRSSVLNNGLLDDAGSEGVADLSKVIAEGTVVGFTGSPTMVRHWRSSGCRGWPDPGGGVHGSSKAPRSGQVSIPACGR